MYKKNILFQLLLLATTTIFCSEHQAQNSNITRTSGTDNFGEWVDYCQNNIGVIYYLAYDGYSTYTTDESEVPHNLDAASYFLRLEEAYSRHEEKKSTAKPKISVGQKKRTKISKRLLARGR